MELRTYLNVLIARWWIILPVFLLSVVATWVLTSRQPVVYETRNTFVLYPNSSLYDEPNFIRVVLEMLSSREEIIGTVAEVANSNYVRKLASEKLSLSTEQIKTVSVEARGMVSTNVLEITVRGGSPVVVRDFANAVSMETENYVNNLYDIVKLESLDEAQIPKTPVSPNMTNNLVLGGMLGLILAGGLAYFAEYLSLPSKETETFNILDPESGAFNTKYLMTRLQQEISRSKHNNYPFSVSLIKFCDSIPNKQISTKLNHGTMRQVVTLFKTELRDEDVIARLDDSTLAILLPDVQEKTAKGYISELQSKAGTISFVDKAGNNNEQIHSISSVVTFCKNININSDELLTQAKHALEQITNPNETT